MDLYTIATFKAFYLRNTFRQLIEQTEFVELEEKVLRKEDLG